MNSRLSAVGKNIWRRLSAGSLILTLVFMQNVATADSEDEYTGYSDMLDDKFSLWIGGFFPDVKSSIRLDSSAGGPGDDLDFENLLGLEDSKATLWGGFRWRISRRNQFEFEFNDLNRSGSVSGDLGPLNIGEYTVTGMAEINTEFDLTLARLTYGFSVIRKQKHDLAVKAGVHIANFGVKINVSGNIEDDMGNSICTPGPCRAKPIETDDYTIPLPHLGLSYTYAFTPKWGLRAQGLGFAIKIEDVKGVMTEVDLDLHYQPWRHVGFGGGLRYWTLTVEDTGNAFLNGEFEYVYWGPAIYVLGSF
jgi:hypothetical protein